MRLASPSTCGPSSAPLPHEKCDVRSLPLPLALTARLTPVVVLACAGWALTSGPAAPTSAEHSSDRSGTATGDGAVPSDGSSTAPPSYSGAPAPCTSVPVDTLKSLVPGAKTAGKEIPSTDAKLRRTCSWNALRGFDYRWLDVSFEVAESNQEATREYQQRVSEKSGGGAVPGLGDSAYSVVNLTTQDKQQTREGVVLVRVANALVVVTYNGSDFETKKAPDTDEINKGAIRAAKAAVAALQGRAAGGGSGNSGSGGGSSRSGKPSSSGKPDDSGTSDASKSPSDKPSSSSSEKPGGSGSDDSGDAGDAGDSKGSGTTDGSGSGTSG